MEAQSMEVVLKQKIINVMVLEGRELESKRLLSERRCVELRSEGTEAVGISRV